MSSILKTYITLQKSVHVQKEFLKRSIKPELDNFLLHHSVPAKTITKIYNYYGMGVPALLGLLYAMPRNYKIDNKEREALTYVGALTGIIDDAFDEDYMDVSRVWDYLMDQNSFQAHNDSEALMCFLGGKVLKLLPIQHQSVFLETAKTVFKLQEKSLLQKNKSGALLELFQITREKGGLPFVLYRYCLNNAAAPEELDLIFELGASMQLGNDIFDVHKDLQQEIKTIPNTISHIKHLETVFYEWMQLGINQANKVHFDNEAIRKTYVEYYLLGMSRCLVCMEQFQKLENESGGMFLPLTYTRKQLICDMEKIINICKSIFYYKKMKKSLEFNVKVLKL